MRDKSRLVDEDIAALFTTQGKHYGLEPAIAESEAIKRIKRNISTLDNAAQREKLLKLEDYTDFKKLPEERQRQAIRYARERSLDVAEAARELSGSARS